MEIIDQPLHRPLGSYAEYVIRPLISSAIIVLAAVSLGLKCSEKIASSPSSSIGLPVSIIAITGLHQIYQLFTIRRLFFLRTERAEEGEIPPNNCFSRLSCLINNAPVNGIVTTIFAFAAIPLSIVNLMDDEKNYTNCRQITVLPNVTIAIVSVINISYSIRLSLDLAYQASLNAQRANRRQVQV